MHRPQSSAERPLLFVRTLLLSLHAWSARFHSFAIPAQGAGQCLIMTVAESLVHSPFGVDEAPESLNLTNEVVGHEGTATEKYARLEPSRISPKIFRSAFRVAI